MNPGKILLTAGILATALLTGCSYWLGITKIPKENKALVVGYQFIVIGATARMEEIDLATGEAKKLEVSEK
jgi:hypothetical protein